MTGYIAVDIGCRLECGEGSALIGVFDTAEAAQAACDEWDEIGWRGGQHNYEVFDLSHPAGHPPAKV